MSARDASRASRRRGSRAAGPLATAALTLIGAFLALELWKADLAVPLRYTQVDDTKFYFMLVKGILDHGWYQTNSNLGAPFGQQLYDFPQGADNLNFLMIKVLGLFTSNWALVTNLFFLLTFPLTGLAAYHGFRQLDVSPPAATVCSVLFALLPYHFYRHESQVLLSAYYSVPLTSYLFISLVAGKPVLRPWKRSALTLATCVVIGSAGLYYAGFALVLLPAATIVAVIGGRGRRALGTGLTLCLVIGATLAFNLAPSIIYGHDHGPNTQIARTPIESEQLGLRLSTLLLPVQGDRLPLLSNLSINYAAATSPGYCEACNETLGIVGDGGFLALCLVGLAALVGVAGVAGAGRIAWEARFRPAALGIAVAFGIGTIGGVSALIAYFVTPDLRGWNRLSLFIAFFSFLAVGMLLDGAGRRLRRRAASRFPARRATAVWAILLIVVLGIGAVDETSDFYLVDYSIAARAYQSDQSFGAQVDAQLPRGSDVFELPYVPFPEGYHVAGVPITPSQAFTTSYEMLRPYLNTTGLNFSLAAIKGRPSDWESALSAKPLNLAVAGAAAAGFSGIYVDPRGYGTGAPRVGAWLRQLLGVAPIVSRLGNAWFYDLRPYARALDASAPPAAIAGLRHATLYPLQVACGSGPAELDLTNPGPTAVQASLSATVADGTPGSQPVVITFPGGAAERRTIYAATPTLLQRRLVVPPGTSVVTFSTVAGPAVPSVPAAGLVISDATLTDAAFAPFRRFRTPAGRLAPQAGLIAPSCAVQSEAASPSPTMSPTGRGSRRSSPA
jgi:phosphoglycerol transferase